MFDFEKSSRQRCDGLDPKHGKKMCLLPGRRELDPLLISRIIIHIAHCVALRPGVGPKPQLIFINYHSFTNLVNNDELIEFAALNHRGQVVLFTRYAFTGQRDCLTQ